MFKVGDIVRYKNNTESPGSSWIQDHILIHTVKDGKIYGKIIKAVHRSVGMEYSWFITDRSIVLVSSVNLPKNFKRDQHGFRLGKT